MVGFAGVSVAQDQAEDHQVCGLMDQQGAKACRESGCGGGERFAVEARGQRCRPAGSKEQDGDGHCWQHRRPGDGEQRPGRAVPEFPAPAPPTARRGFR